MKASVAARALRAAATLAALLATPIAVPHALARAPRGSFSADAAALHQRLKALAYASRGVVGYSILDLDAGVALARRGDETFPTPSLSRVPGSGPLQFLHDGIEVTVRDAAWLMTTSTLLRLTSVAMDSSVTYGLGGTTPNEILRRFALLARGAAVSPSADSTMLETLAPNEDDQMLQRFATMGRRGEAIAQAGGPPPIRR